MSEPNALAKSEGRTLTEYEVLRGELAPALYGGPIITVVCTIAGVSLAREGAPLSSLWQFLVYALAALAWTVRGWTKVQQAAARRDDPTSEPPR